VECFAQSLPGELALAVLRGVFTKIIVFFLIFSEKPVSGGSQNRIFNYNKGNFGFVPSFIPR
jgi:hypothetical protein